MIRNWKTTILGAILGGLVAIQPLLETGGEIDVKQLIMGFLIAAIAAFAKDADKSGV